MIWLITLFLLGVAAWLLLNGLNEKQWVDAHQHDDDVAKDEGLFKSLTNLTSAKDGERGEGDLVSNVKQRTADAGNKLGERLTEARNSDTADKLRSKTAGITDRIKDEMTNEDGVYNKIKNKVASGVEKAGKQVDEKIVNRPKS